jgi:hypothetical protein
MSQTIYNKQDYLYQKCYCEENIYKLAENIADKENDRIAFISNDIKKIPIFKKTNEVTIWVVCG